MRTGMTPCLLKKVRKFMMKMVKDFTLDQKQLTGGWKTRYVYSFLEISASYLEIFQCEYNSII